MQIMYTDEEEREMRQYAEDNERARNAYIQSADYRSSYVAGLENRLIKMSALLAWARRTVTHPDEINLLELDGIVNQINKAIPPR